MCFFDLSLIFDERSFCVKTILTNKKWRWFRWEVDAFKTKEKQEQFYQVKGDENKWMTVLRRK